MLNLYQLWLDDLYPRAKFADALAIVEKVGHTKRMQVDRKAWIDEGKPKHITEQEEDDLDASVPDEEHAQDDRETMEGVGSNDHPAGTRHDSEIPIEFRGHTHTAAEEPDEDELDALLAEGVQPGVPAPKALPPLPAPAHDDPFADEMEAMEGMEDMW